MAGTMITMDESKILSTLAEGTDPFTGESLPGGHLLQHPQVVRALFHAAGALDHQKKNAKRSAALPAKAGSPWSREEEEQLVREFDDKTPIPDIARRHGRSEAGITSRLVRLGKIAGEDAGNAGRPMKANPVPGTFRTGSRTGGKVREQG